MFPGDPLPIIQIHRIPDGIYMHVTNTITGEYTEISMPTYMAAKVSDALAAGVADIKAHKFGQSDFPVTEIKGD